MVKYERRVMKWRVSYADNLLNSFERRSVYTISLTGRKTGEESIHKACFIKKVLEIASSESSLYIINVLKSS